MQERATLTANLILDTRELVPDRHVLHTTVGPSGEVVVLSSESRVYEYEERERRGKIYRVAKPVLGPHRYLIHRVYTDGTDVSLRLETEHLFLQAHPLGPDRWLLVHGWANQRMGEEASIIASNGQLVSSFAIGDGIEQVATSADGLIWVSYFDEGVFSQDGIGQAGMVCFDHSGHQLFQFNDIASQHQIPTIDDCYAMNVGNDGDVWLYYYSKFPLVRIRNGQFDRIWRDVPIAGSRNFAVDGETVLFSSAYRARDSLFQLALDTYEVKEFHAIDSSGSPIAFVYTVGRGANLYLYTEHQLYVVQWPLT